jgi:hypothetical protein
VATHLQTTATNLQPAATPDADTYCALLELPAEMRNKIYRYALINENCTTLTDSNCNQPALLRTCRQIRTEASILFYSQNKFQLDVSQPLHARGLPHVQYWLWTMPDRDEFNIIVEGNIEWYLFNVGSS